MGDQQRVLLTFICPDFVAIDTKEGVPGPRFSWSAVDWSFSTRGRLEVSSHWFFWKNLRSVTIKISGSLTKWSQSVLGFSVGRFLFGFDPNLIILLGLFKYCIFFFIIPSQQIVDFNSLQGTWLFQVLCDDLFCGICSNVSFPVPDFFFPRGFFSFLFDSTLLLNLVGKH